MTEPTVNFDLNRKQILMMLEALSSLGEKWAERAYRDHLSDITEFTDDILNKLDSLGNEGPKP
jgi:hypothetical protein